MNDHRLETLLHQAAEGERPPSLPGDLADRVRRRFARRRARRRFAGGGSALVVLLVFTLAAWRVVGRTPGAVDLANRSAGTDAAGVSAAPLAGPAANTDNPDVAAIQAELKELRKRMARLEAQIKADAAQRRFDTRLAALRRELRRPDPRDLDMARIESAAFSVARRAETCEKQNRHAEARQEYEQLVKLFPNTSWSEVAQEKLGGKYQKP
ncbi:MAG: hypothetical protein JW719_00365 [Pirellulales bacterium]|nr:hypothetical protein [Pirellulales bacterium]